MHHRATILSHLVESWRVGEDGYLSARVPGWPHVDPPNIAPVRVKRPASFACMTGKVSDRVARYTVSGGHLARYSFRNRAESSSTRRPATLASRPSKQTRALKGTGRTAVQSKLSPAGGGGAWRGEVGAVDDSRGERASGACEQGELRESTQLKLRAQRPSEESGTASTLSPPAPSASPSTTSILGVLASTPFPPQSACASISEHNSFRGRGRITCSAETAANACDCLAFA